MGGKRGGGNKFEVPQSKKRITLLHNIKIIRLLYSIEWNMGKVGNNGVESIIPIK